MRIDKVLDMSMVLNDLLCDYCKNKKDEDKESVDNFVVSGKSVYDNLPNFQKEKYYSDERDADNIRAGSKKERIYDIKDILHIINKTQEKLVKYLNSMPDENERQRCYELRLSLERLVKERSVNYAAKYAGGDKEKEGLIYDYLSMIVCISVSTYRENEGPFENYANSAMTNQFYREIIPCINKEPFIKARISSDKIESYELISMIYEEHLMDDEVVSPIEELIIDELSELQFLVMCAHDNKFCPYCAIKLREYVISIMKIVRLRTDLVMISGFNVYERRRRILRE